MLGIVSVGPLAACGDDGGDSLGPSSTAASESDIDAYCKSVQSWVDSISGIDGRTVETTLGGLAEAAAAARAVVDFAPGEVRVAHEDIASAADALVAGIQERDPQTVDELDQADEEVGERLSATYGDLDEESRHVEEFAERECDLTFG